MYVSVWWLGGNCGCWRPNRGSQLKKIRAIGRWRNFSSCAWKNNLTNYGFTLNTRYHLISASSLSSLVLLFVLVFRGVVACFNHLWVVVCANAWSSKLIGKSLLILNSWCGVIIEFLARESFFFTDNKLSVSECMCVSEEMVKKCDNPECC